MILEDIMNLKRSEALIASFPAMVGNQGGNCKRIYQRKLVILRILSLDCLIPGKGWQSSTELGRTEES